MAGGDPFDLRRFVEAQAPVYERVVEELRRGRKESHWMWFVFPQIAGLGFSATSRRYAIASVAEAEAYLRHPVLGRRLIECVEAVNGFEGSTAAEIFGAPDDMKFRSCLTLFGRAEPANAVFPRALEKYFGGVEDAETLARISGGRAPPA